MFMPLFPPHAPPYPPLAPLPTAERSPCRTCPSGSSLVSLRRLEKHCRMITRCFARCFARFACTYRRVIARHETRDCSDCVGTNEIIDGEMFRHALNVSMRLRVYYIHDGLVLSGETILKKIFCYCDTSRNTREDNYTLGTFVSWQLIL